MDLFPTFVKLAGGAVPEDRILDGVDQSAMLLENRDSPRNILHYYRGNELYALRKGRYKAHFITWDGYSREEPQLHDPPLLFDLGRDPGEQFNIAAQHPETLADLILEAKRHLAGVQPGEPQFYELSPCWEQRQGPCRQGCRRTD